MGRAPPTPVRHGAVAVPTPVYEPEHSMANGTGYEWRADWHLRPGVPAGAKRLTVTLIRAPERRVDLDLEEQP